MFEWNSMRRRSLAAFVLLVWLPYAAVIASQDRSNIPSSAETLPGSRAPEPVRDPDGWRGAERLSVAEKALVRDCWAMLDSLRESFTIHQVVYIWDIGRSLEAQDIAALVAAAAEYVNLLDYEAVHGKEVGTYYGDEGDVTPLRADLDQIPLARDLRAGRASPWLPLHRLA